MKTFSKVDPNENADTFRLRDNSVETVVWTQIDRCIFDVTENEAKWKRISVDIDKLKIKLVMTKAYHLVEMSPKTLPISF